MRICHQEICPLKLVPVIWVPTVSPPHIKAKIRRRRGRPPPNTHGSSRRGAPPQKTRESSGGGGVPPLLLYTHSRMRRLKSASGGGVPPLKCDPSSTPQKQNTSHISVRFRYTDSRAAGPSVELTFAKRRHAPANNNRASTIMPCGLFDPDGATPRQRCVVLNSHLPRHPRAPTVQICVVANGGPFRQRYT